MNIYLFGPTMLLRILGIHQGNHTITKNSEHSLARVVILKC